MSEPNIVKFGRYLGVGVHSALGAVLAEKHLFDFAWLSSFELSASQGLPDFGLTEQMKVELLYQEIRRVATIPLIIDFDSLHDDPVQTYHSVVRLAQVGASSICLEDNDCSKRSSLYNGYRRNLASVKKQCNRITAARLAAERWGCAVIARTEALVVQEGVAQAVSRAAQYVNAGASAVFVQSLDPSGAELFDFLLRWERRSPVLIAPTRFPSVPNERLYEAGVTHLIYANHGIRAICKALTGVFSCLRAAPSASAVETLLSSVGDVSELVGEDRMRAIERQVNSEREVLS